MKTCENSVKRTAIGSWTPVPAKGVRSPKNGRRCRALSDRLRLVRWGKAMPQSKLITHFANQIRLSTVDGPTNLGADSPLESLEPTGQLLTRMPGWKRALDLTLIALTYPIWLPLMLLIMAAIKISSPGPIFYRQERVGLRGRTFMIFKFRSMKVHAQTSWHEWHFQRLMRDGAPMTKLDADDSRIISGGRFLRATGLDELPQIFNVLRGEMSLVGPRPCTRVEFEKYEERERERVNAPPGLTGYWQVNGKNKTTFQQMIEMDLYYAKNSSVPLDLWIMAKTPAALFEQTLNLVQQPTVALAKLSAGMQTAPAHSRDEGAAIFIAEM